MRFFGRRPRFFLSFIPLFHYQRLERYFLYNSFLQVIVKLSKPLLYIVDRIRIFSHNIETSIKTFAIIRYWYKLSKYVINVKYLKNSNTLYPKWIENALESSALECPNYDYPAFRHDKICETDSVLYRS